MIDWISGKDKLPNHGEQVLIWNGGMKSMAKCDLLI